MTEHSKDQNELIDSFYRCRHDERFLDTFYDQFLSMSPVVAEMFSDTDFKVQKLMLRQSLLEMLCFDRGIQGTRDEIVRLGRRHKELGITEEMYAMWLDALCAAVKKHDPRYTADLEQLWRSGMLTSIKEMLAVDGPDAPESSNAVSD